MELPMRKYDENYNKITQKVANIRSLVLFEPKNDQLLNGFGQSNRFGLVLVPDMVFEES